VIQHATSSPLSSHTQLTLTSSLPHPRRPPPQYLPSLHRSSPSKELLESDGGIIRTVFLRSLHTNSDCSQTHRSTGTGHCTWIFIVAISKPCTKAWRLQKPRIIIIKLKRYLYLNQEVPVLKSAIQLHTTVSLQKSFLKEANIYSVASWSHSVVEVIFY